MSRLEHFAGEFGIKIRRKRSRNTARAAEFPIDEHFFVDAACSMVSIWITFWRMRSGLNWRNWNALRSGGRWTSA
jgi:hypothetical protein